MKGSRVSDAKENSLSGSESLRTWFIVKPIPSMASFKLTSWTGCFLASDAVKCLSRMVVPNVSVSMSSEPAA